MDTEVVAHPDSSLLRSPLILDLLDACSLAAVNVENFADESSAMSLLGFSGLVCIGSGLVDDLLLVF